jgi:tetratricopeptide (TPR) repeat protein
MEAIWLPGTATIVVASALFYFLANQLRERDKKAFGIILFLTGIVVAIFSLLGVTTILTKLQFLPAIFRQTSFTTMGGNLPAAIFLAVIIPIGLGIILEAKDSMQKTFYTVALAIATLGLFANIYNLLPGKPTSPRFASFSDSWSIAVDSLKASPLLGVGPGNYLTAFNIYRPISYNQTDLWLVKFTQGRDFFLTNLTEVGLLGIAGFTMLIYLLYKNLQKDYKERKLMGWGLAGTYETVSLTLVLAAYTFFSTNVALILLLFALLALVAKGNKVNVNLSAAQSALGSPQKEAVATRIPAILVALPIVALIIAYAYFGSKIALAEYTFGQSLVALSNNDGAKTYDTMLRAINANPRVDRYRASFSQVNFALANSIAQQAQPATEGGETKEATLTEEQRATISQLIQQSIAEAKATVALNLPRSGNWKLLADTYRAIIPFAQGADQFAVQSYAQAVALDPINPNLRLDLGGVYYQLQQYAPAIEQFKLAVVAKPDLANSHYNLAMAYKANKQFAEALEQMTITLSLVDRDSPDYELAKKEVENLESQVPKTTPQTEGEEGTGDLKNPPQAQEPVLEPPLDLPEEAAPPEGPEIPVESPSPEASPEVSPTPTPLP